MAVMLKAAILFLVCVTSGSVLKAKPNVITNVLRDRHPRSIDLSAAHSLINEPKLRSAVVPKKYKLAIETDTAKSIFRGKVTINVEWESESSEVILHAHQDLQIPFIEIRAYRNDSQHPEIMTPFELAGTGRQEKKPILPIFLTSTVPKGTVGEIEITFQGTLELGSSEAIFQTAFDDTPRNFSLGNERVKLIYNFASEFQLSQFYENYRNLIGTHLRPNYARKVFPCFDEPIFKTPFEISVRRPKNMTVLSNMPVKTTELISGDPENTWDHFEVTPPISTYSVGIVIANLTMVDSIKLKILNHEIQVNIWSREEFKEALNGTMDKIEIIYKEIVNYLNMAIPMKKIDFVALPYYTGIKPADSWGLIVFKESDLAAKGYLTLTQELMYQWFGAMVSPAWWNDAHINKALVGYLSASIAIKIDNGVEMDGKWPMTILYSLYYEFSKRYPHSRITGMKQEAICSKIELILRMLDYTIGKEAFKEGIRNFIKEKKYKTFISEDVWKALHKAAEELKTIPKDLCLVDVATSWISKDRLPVVIINRNYERKTAKVIQRLYLRERPHDVPGQDKLLWRIPLVILKQDKLDFSNTTPVAWTGKTNEIQLDDMPNSDKFIILNPEEIGPFPVNYDKENWNMLSKFLQSSSRLSISVNTRAKLLHDAWNLAYAGDLSFATALDMTIFLEKERDPLVWDPVFTMIDHIGRHIDSSSVHKKFEKYVRKLLTPLYEELEKDSALDNSKTNLKALAKGFLCIAGYKPCIEEAQEMFKVWMEAADPDEGNPISNRFICPVFKWGTQEEWEFGLERVINFPPGRKLSERTYLLKTLAGCPITAYKIERLLNITILEKNGNFSDNDIFLIFSMLTGGSRGYTTLFNFLRGNWDIIKLRFTNNTNLWDNIISSATSVFTTQEGLDMVKKLYVERQGEFGSAEHIIEKSLRNIREETKWSDENLPVIEQWLDDYLKKPENEGKDDEKFLVYQ